jgi:hypothetical protein
MPPMLASQLRFHHIRGAPAWPRWALWLLLATGCGPQTPLDATGTNSSASESGTGGGGGGVVGAGGSTSVNCNTGCTADQDCIHGSCVPSPWYGMPCSTNDDCPSDAICCDGSDESCDGTRLPSGNATNPGEFVVSADGLTVTDRITGLLWQRDGSNARTGCTTDSTSLTCTWAEAKAYCAGLVLGSLSGWRLPAVVELSTIADFTITNPAIDATAFPNTPAGTHSGWYWTSTPYNRPDSPSANADFVYFYDGSTYASDVGLNIRVRCVRGSRCYPKSRFSVLAGGLVRDTLTQLVWQQDGSGTRSGCGGTGSLTCSWAEAQAYCAGLGSGFRLPTVKELRSIVDFTVAFPGPMINQTAFPNTPAELFWTSAPYADDAWAVSFIDGGSSSWGFSDLLGVGGDIRVRCGR